jgi:tight adherence protein B
MLVILIIVCAVVFFFCIFTIILHGVAKDKLKVEERIKDFVLEEKEEPKKTTAKQKKLKVKKNTGLKTRKELAQIENELYNVGIQIPVQQFIAIWISASIVIPIILVIVGVPSVICIALVALIAFFPMVYVRGKKKKRKNRLEGQLIEAIGVLSNALKAGHSFQSAMSNIATDMEAPISEEFGRVFKETQRGMTLEESMNRMVERTDSDDLDMLCTAIIIQRKVGGNLAEVLEKISGTIQSRISLRKEIKTRTASGRMSGFIVGALPFLLLGMMTVLNKEYAAQLFETPAGRAMLAFGFVWECIGFAVIKKVVTIKY